ncbi:MAG: phage baseplate assembly protein V [bacterium]|nr:phage baseplate assembly protein V [bacterium]
MRAELKTIVEQARPDLSAYMRFPVRGVVTEVDAAAYTVSVQPDDPALAILPRCEILAVWATSAARLVALPTAGDQVMVSFEGGQPDKPFVSGFLTASGPAGKHLVLEQGQARVVISADGLVEIESAVKVHVKAPAVELGSAAAEQLIKGNTFQSLFNTHQHIGNKGAPTSTPISPLTGAELSNTSRTE